MTIGLLSLRAGYTQGGGGSYADGSGSPAGGTAQLTTLFSGYALRPPWNVPGVDYAVGPHSGTSFTSIVASPPAGTSYNSGTHLLSITADNVTLDGYDFTVSNGVSIYGGNFTGLTVRNCKFGGSNYAGASTGPIDVRGPGATFEYNTIDGSSPGGSISQSTLFFVFPNTTGLMTFRYNELKGVAQHFFEIVTGCTLDIRFNLFNDSPNVATDAHYNCLQFSDGTIDLNCSFNTIYQSTPPSTPPGEMLQAYMNGTGTQHSPNISNNVLISKNSGCNSALMHGSASGTGTTNLTGTPICSENYMDPTGTSSGAIYTGSFSGWTATVANRNMTNAGTITL